MDPIDRKLKDFLERERSTRGTRDAFPDPEEVYLYLMGELGGARLERMLDHLKRDREAQELVLRARELFEPSDEAGRERVPAKLLDRAKSLRAQARPAIGSGRCPHCGEAITPFKTSAGRRRIEIALWAAAAGAAFLTSFFVPRYFLQFLALTVVFGVKAALDARSARTQVLIYKALASEEGRGSEARHLHPPSGRL